jgi:thimet oligopeptidase
MKMLLLTILFLHPSALRAQVQAVPAANALVGNSLTTRQMASAYKAAESDLLGSLSSIAAIPAGERSFANTVRAMDLAQAAFSGVSSPMSFLNMVSPDPRVRRMASAIERRAQRTLIGLDSREDLYKALLEARARGESLDAQDQKLLDESIRGFELSGMGLPEEKRRRAEVLRKRLAELQQAFEVNINEYQDSLEVEPGRLAGLPQGDLDRLKRTADGKAILTLDYPSYSAVMDNVRDAGVRRALQFKFENRAAEKNIPILEEALGLRRELAVLLGYKNHAEYALVEKMAKTPEKVWSFLKDLAARLAGPGRKEMTALLDLKRQDDPSAGRIEPWDTRYYGSLLQKKLFEFDPEEVRQYFPAETVVEGTLEVYQELLGLKFVESKAGSWHPDARLFEVLDSKTGARQGWFYLDLYPREGKYTHAAVFNLTDEYLRPDGSRNEPAGAMAANFTRPSGGVPSLLTMDEVWTFFHEFGHLMHHILDQTRHPSQASFKVALDFVEVPSQTLEDFVWTPEVLERISGHYADPSRKLPKDLLDKVAASQRHLAATQNLRQVVFGALDMMIHTLPPPFDLDEVTRRAYEMAGFPAPEQGTHMLASFGHIMGGYDAGYYGYHWAKVISEAIMDVFLKTGVLNPETGARFRREILEAGAGRDEMESVKAFLGGKEPGMEPFLRYLGLEAK